MIDHSIVLYVSIKPSYHNVDDAASMFRQPATRKMSRSSIEVNTAIFAGSITKFFDDQGGRRLLDTPNQFDYDSACTMILNLE